MESVATDIFKINRSAICRTMLMLYSKPWVVSTALLLLPAIFAGIFIDLRWLIIALMIVFIVIPMILAFAFFYYGLNPISVINSTPHSLEFREDGIMATLYTPVPTDQKKVEEPEKENTPTYELRSKTTIDYSAVSDFVVGLSDIILRTKLSGKGFLSIPVTAFIDKNHMIKAIDLVNAGIKNNN